MPAYDYKCNSCGNRFEERQSFYDDPIAFCPKCDSQASRQFVAVPIVFKGSGFYVNDYGKGSSSYTGTKSETNGASADSGKSEESSSKPKAKAAAGSDE